MAAVFDVSVTFFDRELRPLFAAKHIRHTNRRPSFYARGCIDDWSAAKVKKPVVGPIADPLAYHYLLDNF